MIIDEEDDDNDNYCDADDCLPTQFDHERGGPAAKWCEYIRDVCANRPWLEGVTEDSVRYFRRTLLPDRRTKNWSRRDLAAFSIYVQARKSGCGIAPKSMLSIAGCEMSKLRQLEHMFAEAIVDDSPAFYITQLAQSCDLTRREVIQVVKIAERLDGECFGCYPRTIAAALVLLHVSSRSGSGKKLNSLTFLAGKAQTSPNSIRNVMPQIRQLLPDTFHPDAYRA